jgi:hypothetical protein
VKPLKTENIDVPPSGLLDVADTHCYVINSFELHESLDRSYRIAWIYKGGERPQLRRLIIALSAIFSIVITRTRFTLATLVGRDRRARRLMGIIHAVVQFAFS